MQSFLLSVGEKFIPILKESKFKETGRLTPEEYVAAGDYLVFKCPTWNWSSGDYSKIRPYLPADKQFLITRNVPAIPSETLTQLEENSDFVDNSDNFRTVDILKPQVIEEMEIIQHLHESVSRSYTLENSDEIPDIEDFNAHNILLVDDPIAIQDTIMDDLTDENCNFINTQTYDLYISYDKFYQTPRMWISGYELNGSQLSPEKVLDLISQDHAHKTVTVEAFPHMSQDLASVHPCKHAVVMKKIIDQYLTVNKEIRVDQYLVLFLKFMSSIMPSVDYDHTMTME